MRILGPRPRLVTGGARVAPRAEPGDGVGQRLADRSGGQAERSRLRDASKCMVRRVSRTPVTVALGGRPVTRSAQNSLTKATARPSGYGTRQRGTGTPVSSERMPSRPSERQVLAPEQVAAAGLARAPSSGPGPRPRRGRRSGSACSPSGRGACPGRSRGSGGSAARGPGPRARPASSGWRSTTGRPARARAIASFSARSFDRQYGPTASDERDLDVLGDRPGRPGAGQDALGARVQDPLGPGRRARRRARGPSPGGSPRRTRPGRGPEVRVGRQVVDPRGPRERPATSPRGRGCRPGPPRRPRAGAPRRPRAARPPGPARPAPTSRSTRWLPMNPAPPVTIVSRVHADLPSAVIERRLGPSAMHLVEFLLRDPAVSGGSSTPAATSRAKTSG